MTKKVAVIGAGITGITTAYYLAQSGYDVYVYEQERYPAMRTSFANGGQISVSNSEVWTTWSNIKKAIKWLFTKDAPLLIRPKFSLSQWRWITKFLVHTADNSWARNTVQTVKMGLESRKLYKEIIDKEQLDFDFTESGILHFYKDEKYWAHAQKIQELYQGNGCEWRLLDAQEVAKKDPALSKISAVLGGAWTGADSTGDIHKFCYELADVLARRYSVKFFYNWAVTDLDIVLDHHDAVVISAGVGSTKLAKLLGENIDVYPVKGYSITINNVDPKVLPRVSLLDDQAKIVTSTLGNKFRVAGTAELTDENYDIRRDRIEPLLRWVHENFPQINTHDYSSWACLRPMTPNMMPIVKQSDKNPKVFYNTGHGHLGWTLGPYTAKQVTGIINGNNR